MSRVLCDDGNRPSSLFRREGTFSHCPRTTPPFFPVPPPLFSSWSRLTPLSGRIPPPYIFLLPMQLPPLPFPPERARTFSSQSRAVLDLPCSTPFLFRFAIPSRLSHPPFSLDFKGRLLSRLAMRFLSYKPGTIFEEESFASTRLFFLGGDFSLHCSGEALPPPPDSEVGVIGRHFFPGGNARTLP